jgi:hypothetical protein
LREVHASGAPGPITVTGEAFDLEVGQPELAVGESSIVAAVAVGGGSGATINTRPAVSVDDLLRRTNPIPRGTSEALREAAAAAYGSAAPAPASLEQHAPIDHPPATTLPLPPAFGRSPSQPPGIAAAPGTTSEPPRRPSSPSPSPVSGPTGSAVPLDRIATRRGHVPAHRVRSAQKVSGGGTGAGSQTSAPTLPVPSSVELPGANLRDAKTVRDPPSATADVLRASRGRSWGPALLVIAIVLALGGLAVGYFMTQ